MPENRFGEDVAARYDESHAGLFEAAAVDPVVDFLADAARAGAALEPGIGTGRIALPFAAGGVRVHGIDLSAAMVARLKAKPGSDAIEVAVGDFATTTVGGTSSLAYLVFNTIMSLTTQDEQVACFANVAAQRLVSHHYRAVDGALERWSLPCRYVWPAELDLMARLAGMALRERWGGWRREPFTTESRSHVSVWETPS